jgi:alpha-galactosidase
VGSDVGLDWDDLFFMRLLHRERISTRQSISNTIFRRQLDGRAFGSDPDVFFLRDHNIRLSDAEKSFQCALDALLGSVWLTSDDLNAYDEEKSEQYRRLARLRDANDIQVDPDRMAVRYFLDGEEHLLRHPHIF